jgi:integrase
MRLEIVSRNVVSLVHSPEHRGEEFNVWEVDEARAFLTAARECRYSAFWTLWLTTGARPHELLGLRPQDVDLDAGELTITKQLRRSGSRGRLKTETSRRTVRIPPVAIDALREHQKRLLAEGLRASPWVFPAALARNRAGKIIPDQEPRHTDYRNLIGEHYETIVAAARVVGKDGVERPLKRIRPYDLRHTAATLALKAGVPIKVVSEALGHASIALTQGTYQHVLPSMRDEHVDRVQALFGPSKTA